MHRYIVFEGIDGSGKTTVSRLVAHKLHMDGYTVGMLTAPSDTNVGRKVRSILSIAIADGMPMEEEAALLFLADIAYRDRVVLEPMLRKCDVVISDRSFWSTVVYQDVSPDIAMTYCRVPDEVFLLDVEPKVARKRLYGSDDVLDQVALERIEYLRDRYLEIAKKRNWRILDSTMDTPESITKKIVEKIEGGSFYE